MAVLGGFGTILLQNDREPLAVGGFGTVLLKSYQVSISAFGSIKLVGAGPALKVYGVLPQEVYAVDVAGISTVFGVS